MKFLNRYFFEIKMLLLSFLTGFVLSGCATTGIMGQAAITALETRTIDASFEQVYSAATEGLFDLGYTIEHSDKNSGIIVGEKKMEKPEARWKKFWDELGGTDRPESAYYNTLQLTLFVQSIDEKTTKVRIKTAVNKLPQLDKKSIDEVWLYIDRQVLMKSSPDSNVIPKRESK